MSQELKVAVFAGLIPGVIAALLLLMAWWRARRSEQGNGSGENVTDRPPEPAWARAAAPLALALGYPFADYAVNGLPKLWPDSNTYRFGHAAALLGLLGVVEALVRLPGAVAAVARTLVLGAVYWMLVEGYHRSGSIDDATFVGWMLVTALGGAGIIGLADRGCAAAPARAVAPALLLIGGASIPILFFAGSANLSQVSVVLVAWAAAALAVGLLVPSFRLDRGGATCFAGVVIAHAVGTRFQTYAPAQHGPAGLLLLACAPAVLALMAGDGPVAGRAMRAMLATAALLAASGVAVWVAQPQPDPNDPYACLPGRPDGASDSVRLLT